MSRPSIATAHLDSHHASGMLADFFAEGAPKHAEGPMASNGFDFAAKLPKAAAHGVSTAPAKHLN